MNSHLRHLYLLIASIAALAALGCLSRSTWADSSTPTPEPENSKIAYSHDGSIYVMAADGSDMQCLTICNEATAKQYSSIAPAWSHDGKHIAFKGYRENAIDHYWQIFVMNTDGTYLRRLADYDPCDPQIDNDMPTWSPDDSQIVFATCRADKWGLYIVNADGSNLKFLVALGINGDGPTWSPDGQVIAFASGDGIATVDSDGSNFRLLAQYGKSPAWSPGGKQLAFASYPEKAGDTWSLWIMNADGSHLHTLYQGAHIVDSPTWSQDGQSIAFMNQPDSNESYYAGNIYRINVDGSDLRQLTHDGGLWPSWSPKLN